jgi:hypothetical protein
MPISYPISEDYDWDIELKAKDAAVRMCVFQSSRNQAEVPA